MALYHGGVAGSSSVHVYCFQNNHDGPSGHQLKYVIRFILKVFVYVFIVLFQ